MHEYACAHQQPVDSISCEQVPTARGEDAPQILIMIRHTDVAFRIAGLLEKSCRARCTFFKLTTAERRRGALSCRDNGDHNMFAAAAPVAAATKRELQQRARRGCVKAA